MVYIQKGRVGYRGSLHYEKFADGTLKCIEDEIPFELPVGWAWARLGTIAESVGDGDHQPPPQTSYGVPFLVISNVSGGKLSFENTRFVGQEYFSQLTETRKPRNGDLLFTVTGSYGIPVLVDTDEKFCFQRHIAIVRPCIISNRYLYVVLGSSYVKSICDDKATGTAQKTVGLATLRELLVPVAPYKEQMQIYAQTQDALNLIDSISSDKEDMLSIIENTKSKILDLAIRGCLVPQNPADEPASVLLERIRAEKEELIRQGKIKRDKKESIIFRGEDNSYYEKYGEELPQGWVVTNLESLLSYEQPTEYIVESADYCNDYSTPVLTAGKSFILGYTNEATGIYRHIPTIIFDDFTTESKYVDFEFKVKSSAMKILTANTDLVLIRFAYYLMQSIDIDHDSHQRYWISVFSKQEVALPPLAEQQRIVEMVDYLYSLLDNMML